MRAFKRFRIYPASSWRNPYYPAVIAALSGAGHDVFDWREHGFSFESIDPGYKTWSRLEYVEALHSRTADVQFRRDLSAMEQCDVCVLILPAGASAHAEAAWCAAMRKQVLIFLGDANPQPELLHLLSNGFVEDIKQLLFVLTTTQAGDPDADIITIEGYPLAIPGGAWRR